VHHAPRGEPSGRQGYCTRVGAARAPLTDFIRTVVE
jgi:hypothetical protein